MYSKRLLAVLCLQTISALAIIVIASGWGDGKKATYPVTGKVVAGAGKTPAKGAIVMLIPVTFDIKDLERSMATVDDDGAFAITTYNANDGAPAGEYVITLTWPPPRRSVFDDDGEDHLRNPGEITSRSDIGHFS